MTKKEAYEQYNEILDCEGNITITGMDFYPSEILRELDPRRYHATFIDWCDSEGFGIDDLD